VKALAIFNPRAGVAADRARRALDAAPAPWAGIEVQVTRGPGDARAWAAEAAAAGTDVVLAVGGDGTANEVAWGLMGSQTALGLVPVGSGNGLARTLGIPLRPDRALVALAGAATRRMDLGLINGMPFLNVAGAGLDAVVGAEFHERGRGGGRRGVLTYVWLTARRALAYRAQSWSVTADGQAFEGPALIVAFVNGRQYGGGAVVAPGSRLDDGRFDVVIFEDMSFLRVLAAAPRLFLGGIERFPRYRRLRTSQAVVTAPAASVFHRDGEPEAPATRIEVTLQPRALSVLVPRATAEDASGPFATMPGRSPLAP
jgi:YegS/Rv2252/BmrU family lipid kinase